MSSGAPAFEGDPWRPLRTGDGTWTLVDERTGQACHGRAGAWSESVGRFAVPCRLRARAAALGRGGTLRLLDIGFGLGLNTAAALCELARSEVRLEVTALERDPRVLRAALALHAAHPSPAAEPWHGRVLRTLERALLALEHAPRDPDGTEISGAALPGRPGARLRLVLGDAGERLRRLPGGERFDAVFLDPFSPARAPELWSHEFLASVAARMEPEAVLATYSSSLRVRTALAAAGLSVGRGPRVGGKIEGTLASPRGVLPPLSGRTARRIARRAAGNGAEEGVGGPSRNRTSAGPGGGELEPDGPNSDPGGGQIPIQGQEGAPVRLESVQCLSDQQE